MRVSSVKLLPWLCGLILSVASGIYGQSPRSFEADRQKAVSKMQFTDNFRNIQVTSQGLLREHEAGTLTNKQLNKSVRSINKSAKTLRTLIALGNLVDAPESFEKQIDSVEKFDAAIRQLSQLIYDFAHSPVHKNSKVFDTKAAAKAQAQLLTIIELSKVIENRARDYAPKTVSQRFGQDS